jgi:PAS domain S-box-containing protein
MDPPVIDLAAGHDGERHRRGQWLLLAGFVILAAIVIGLAYWAWAQQARSITAQSERSLNAVAELKAGQIAAWTAERRGDARLMSNDKLLSAAVSDLLAGRDVAASAAHVRSYLDEVRKSYGYVDLVLVAPGGRTLMRMPATAAHPLGARVRALIAEAERTGEVVSSDLYLDTDGVARIELIAPILALRPGDPPVGSVVLHTDPSRFLFPFIQNWPFPSDTGETLLVERRGGKVLYLNELRHRRGTALKLTIPVSEGNLPAAMAVRGRTGIVEGMDYRDVPVMAAIAHVPDTDWYVVAKVDKSEVLDPIRRRGWLTAGFTLLVVGLGAAGALLLWRLRERQVDAELVASELKHRVLVENLSAGVVVHAADTSIVLSNPAASRLLGLNAGQLQGKTAMDPGWHFLNADGSRMPLGDYPVNRVVASGDRIDGLVAGVMRTAGEEPVWLLTNAYPIHSGGGALDQVVVTFIDITELIDAQEEVGRLNAELEQRVFDRTAELDSANKELEAFAYSVSHDLRAPLRHISGFSALLAERAGDQLDDKGRHYVDVISTSVRQMGVLIDDLLQFSRTGRAELVIGPVDMRQTLEEALAPLRRETDGRDVEWSIGDLPQVVADRALLRQVWANLVGNAIKYTRASSPARIEIGATGVNGESVFFVRDNGVGFDMQYVHKLFGVFQRLHSDSEFEGSGIGLANVKRIVTRLGGSVWADAEPGRGATFYFSLPDRKETTS